MIMDGGASSGIVLTDSFPRACTMLARSLKVLFTVLVVANVGLLFTPAQGEARFNRECGITGSCSGPHQWSCMNWISGGCTDDSQCECE